MKKWLRYLFWDALLPWIGYGIARFFLYYFKDEETREVLEMTVVLVMPLALCLIRAMAGSPAIQQQRNETSSRWRLISHQVIFALGLLVLMIFEFLAGIFSISKELSLVAWCIPLAIYGVYLFLMFLANKTVPLRDD